jgi:hypothetical protein
MQLGYLLILRNKSGFCWYPYTVFGYHFRKWNCIRVSRISTFLGFYM